MPKSLGSTALSAHFNPTQTSRYTNRKNNSQASNRPQNGNGRKSTFKAGVYYTNCYKEGHTSEECYRLKGYPVGHPLHGKYKPPITRNVAVNDNMGPKVVNSVQGHEASSSTQAESTNANRSDEVFVRIDQLQNQLNQVMLMMQQCQQNPPTGIVNSYTIRKHKFITSVMIKFRAAWVIDSGATDHICITLSVMHDTYLCNPPIHVTLPNSQTVEVRICGKVRINAEITLTNVFTSPHLPTICYKLSN